MPDEAQGLRKGHHCFKCLNYLDYYFDEPEGEFATMKFVCRFDGEDPPSDLEMGGTQTDPERAICPGFVTDKKYLEFRRKIYGRE